MRERFAQLMRTRVGGVPVPVVFVVAVLVLAVILHRRRVAAGKATSAQDNEALDTSSPIGVMANGGYPGQDYAFPSTSSTGGTTSTDTTGDVVNGLLNPNADDVTVTGDLTGGTHTPAVMTPPKVSPAKVSHPAAVHHPTPPPAKKTARKAAPAKKTTVHRATPHKPDPAVHRPTPARKPVPAKPAKKTTPARKPTHRGATGTMKKRLG